MATDCINLPVETKITGRELFFSDSTLSISIDYLLTHMIANFWGKTGEVKRTLKQDFVETGSLRIKLWMEYNCSYNYLAEFGDGVLTGTYSSTPVYIHLTT